MAINEDQIPEVDDTFDVDAHLADDKKPEVSQEPLFRVYKGSRIPISKAVGTLWKKKLDAALTAYDLIYKAWDETFKYYNNNQTKEVQTSRGVFHRGDSTENIVYSNLNVMLPAVYSKDPDIAINTTDEEDEEFVSVLKSVLNVLLRSKNHLNAKQKFKKGVGMALLTNMGTLKLDWTKKDDSREQAMQEMEILTDKLVKCTDSGEAETIYGQIAALENRMEVYKKSGPSLGNVLPHNMIVDPYAEDSDGTDGNWMIERIFFQTDALVAEYTEPNKDEEDGTGRVLTYKPTHKASFTTSEGGKRDDGLGMVMEALSSTADVTQQEEEGRLAYRHMFYSECYLIWDKATRRVMLFHRDDWTWPIWVWSDPLKITRFFPYFIIGFGLSTGGTVTVGETAYYLDQQDEINDINRQVAKIRRTVFDYFFYNSDKTDSDEAEKFIKSVRGEGTSNTKILGVKAGEGKISDVIEAFVPPSFGKDFAALFNKEPILNSINRISNTSDALRGTQFKTNTNESAVQSYQDAARMSIGAKVDAVEDTISDLATSLAELCVQNLDEAAVATLVGQSQAKKWKQMDLETFAANYNFECVAGTTEKPNSLFKKKEAVQIGQVLGQFAASAPVSVLQIMLRVMENAFTEVVIKPADWDAMKLEAAAVQKRGDSTGGAQAGGEQPANGGQPQDGDVEAKLNALPPEVKAKVVQMKQQGMPDEQIKAFLMEQIGGGQGATPPKEAAPQPGTVMN